MAKRSDQRELTAAMCAEALALCGCSNLRMAARAMTKQFDEALQPSGLRATQLVILLAVMADESATIAKLARELAMDPSTLNRNLRPLMTRSLVRSTVAPDGRRRLLSLSAKGRKTVMKAVPLWQGAQQTVVGRFGEKRFREMLGMLREIVQIASAG